MATTSSPMGTLHKLPPEIRDIIYGYLTPPARLPTTVRSHDLGISNVSHRPPPVNLLLACRQICFEALDTYYRKCTFHFEGLLDPGNIVPLYALEEVFATIDAGRAILRNMRKVELNLFWHRLPGGGIGSETVSDTYGAVSMDECDKRVERLERVVQVLRRAEQLRSVTLTWKEIPPRPGEEGPCDWAMKEKVLQTLGALTGVRIIEGDLVTSSQTEQSIVAMIRHLNVCTSKPRKHNRVGSRHLVSLFRCNSSDRTLMIVFSTNLWRLHITRSKHRAIFGTSGDLILDGDIHFPRTDYDATHLTLHESYSNRWA